jgi:hypothetical protein
VHGTISISNRAAFSQTKERLSMTQTRDENQQVESIDQLAKHPLPSWPTSKPGPKVTEPTVGMKRVRGRNEQVVEVDYDQELGKSGARGEK